MRFTDWQCPSCKMVVRHWEPMVGWCSRQACKEQQNKTVELPDKTIVLASVKMVVISTGSAVSGLTIVRDV